jgi:mRNA-degrading endonuclease RelE of RelBE toxin-antitoxin system
MSYTLFLEPAVHTARSKLPGHIRQRMQRAIKALADEPCPPGSRPLDVTGLSIPAAVEIHRLRMEGWRLIYAVNDTESWVRVMGIYRRPPYDYGDLPDLLENLTDDDND